MRLRRYGRAWGSGRSWCDGDLSPTYSSNDDLQPACTYRQKRDSIFGMGKLRLMLSFVLVFAWAAPTAFACLPNPQMTQSEMACCKKMAGDCRMSTEQHPCCKTVSNSPSPVASPQPKIHFQHLAGLVGAVTPFEVTSILRVDQTLAHLGLPPPAPPGPNSILRI